MAADRLVRILGLLAARAGSGTPRLCQVAAEVTGMSGAGIMLLTHERPQASLCTTDAVSSLIEEAQYTLGEGPCVDAHRLGKVIAHPDLDAPAVSPWPAFARRARTAGARAVFGYPIRIGTVHLGALNLYRDRPGSLGDDHHADALVMADVAARAILAAQADAPSGGLGIDIEEDVDMWGVVHQAAGMVSVQLDVSVAEALVRLRALAFVNDRLVSVVARDVVERRLRLDGDE
ncbi:MAG: GAF domain-containing protein [Acidimicrobiales bacterium]